MSGVTAARIALAEAVTQAGLDCEPYPPDAVNPPAAFVDSIRTEYVSGSGFSFCLSGAAAATIIAVAQRHDRAGSTQYLEDLIPPTLAALEGIGGVRVTGVDSGTTQIAGTDLPAVIYTVEFAISS